MKNQNDLLSQILSAHPELNVVEKELVKALVKILQHLEQADVDSQYYLKFLGEARLLAGGLGLVKKTGGGFEKATDLAAALQQVGASKKGQLKTSVGFVDL